VGGPTPTATPSVGRQNETKTETEPQQRIICCISGLKECDGSNLISRFVSDGCSLSIHPFIPNEHSVKTVYVLINLAGDEGARGEDLEKLIRQTFNTLR